MLCNTVSDVFKQEIIEELYYTVQKYVVAFLTGALVSIYCDDEKRTCWVASFMVRVEYRGQGIGKLLWLASWRALGYSERSGEEALRNLILRRASGPPEFVGLTTFSSNPMVHFYKQYGFEIAANEWDQATFGGTVLYCILYTYCISVSSYYSIYIYIYLYTSMYIIQNI